MNFDKFNYLKPTDPVSASVTNVPLHQLRLSTQRVQTQLENTTAGNALFFYDVPCASSVEPGMPVYWNSTNQCCEPAYVSAQWNNTTAEIISGTPADVIGLVYRKTSAQSADLFIAGMLDFPVLAQQLPSSQGRFYLSPIPGHLTTTPPAHALPLGVAMGAMGPCDNGYWVYLNPSYIASPFQHQHYSIDLEPTLVTNSTTKGWRAVTTADNAPTGSVFVYNLEADSQLSQLWSPIPLEAVSVTADWASSDESVGGKELTVNRDSSLIQITSKGIYWKSNTIVPYSSATSTVSYKSFRVTLHFSKICYSNRNEYVTSLRSDENQPFQFVNSSGIEAHSGDLYARFTLKDNPINITEYDGYALRRFNSEWKSEQVPTVNGIAVTGNTSVSGTRTFTHNNKTCYAGIVNLDISPYGVNTELVPQIVKVSAAQEREVYGITYLGLPSDRDSSLRLKFEIPGNYSESSCQFKLRLSCIATLAGSYANATISYLRIPRPTTNVVNVSNLQETTIPCTITRNVTAGTMFEVESSSITVSSGDILIIVISRTTAMSPVYNADLAIARINGVLNVT